MNSVNLIGRITKDPELRTTSSGKSVVAFSIAVDRRTKDDEPDFFACVAWEQTAQNMYKFVRRGDLLGVSGSLSQRHYQDKAGKKISVTEVVAYEVKFLQTRKVPQPEQPEQGQEQDFVEITDNEDELPF